MLNSQGGSSSCGGHRGSCPRWRRSSGSCQSVLFHSTLHFSDPLRSRYCQLLFHLGLERLSACWKEQFVLFKPAACLIFIWRDKKVDRERREMKVLVWNHYMCLLWWIQHHCILFLCAVSSMLRLAALTTQTASVSNQDQQRPWNRCCSDCRRWRRSFGDSNGHQRRQRSPTGRGQRRLQRSKWEQSHGRSAACRHVNMSEVIDMHLCCRGLKLKQSWKVFHHCRGNY